MLHNLYFVVGGTLILAVCSRTPQRTVSAFKSSLTKRKEVLLYEFMFTLSQNKESGKTSIFGE